MRKTNWIPALLAGGLLLTLMGCTKAPAQEAKASAPEEQMRETIETSTQEEAAGLEAPALYEPEPGQWGQYADLYEACLIDTELGMPLSMMHYPTAQMLDLDQNGVPELALYYGVTTAGELLDIFTIEGGTVKRLGDRVTWNDYRYEEYRRDIPAVDEPISWETVLTDSTYMYLDTRILPFDWDYGAFSARLDAKIGRPFWMFTARNYDAGADDGLPYMDTGTYWRFENVDGKIKPVKLKTFGMQWDESQPYDEYSVCPGEESIEITAEQSFAVAVNGESSKEITENFVAERDGAYPPLDTAPGISRRVNLYAGSDLEAELLARRFFRSFHGAPTQDDLQLTAKTALCKFFNPGGRNRGRYLNRFLAGENVKQAISDYYADFADVITEDCTNDWLVEQLPLQYDVLMKETNRRTEVRDVALDEYRRDEDNVTYSFTVTLILYDFDARQDAQKTVTGQIQVDAKQSLVRRLTIDPNQNWTEIE